MSLDLDEKVPITQEERERLNNEFICLMEKRFIDGDDDFDYNKIDYDEEFDSFNDQDLEDKYFDDDWIFHLLISARKNRKGLLLCDLNYEFNASSNEK